MQPCVYIMTNKPHGTLYIGVTSNLVQRVWQHKIGVVEGFTKKYNLHQLVYYQLADDMYAAISKEKQLKNWRREWKINLVNEFNPAWADLYESLL